MKLKDQGTGSCFLKYEQTLTDKLKQETGNHTKRESERVELKIKERDELIGSLEKAGGRNEP
ncbi:MAG: hypothetical protein MZV63_57215 [Marinilabiliales bacterium]|nr:hypothetical protein [Marinilabiliales bacterium]